MTQIPNWRGQQIDVARSTGGVLAVADPWNNVINTGVRPWPAPELIQKIYQSRQVRAFVDAEHAAATNKLGFYSDLQSLHSEDAITWSVFGPVIYAAIQARVAFVRGRPSAAGRLAPLVGPPLRLSHGRGIGLPAMDRVHHCPDTSPPSTLITGARSVSSILAERVHTCSTCLKISGCPRRTMIRRTSAHMLADRTVETCKYAVLHIFAGVLLLMKERLRQAHPSLILKRVEDVAKDSWTDLEVPPSFVSPRAVLRYATARRP